MTLTVTLLVLCSALLHASWNALVKTGADRLMMMGYIAASTGLIALPFLPFTPVPALDVWKIILLSLVLHAGYKLFLVQGYTHGDFGQVYPLSRGLAPAIVTVVGLFWLGEILPPAALVGVALIAAGIVSLAFRRTNGAGLPNDPRALGYAFGTSLFIAAYTLNDGLGGRIAQSPHIYVIWLFACDGLVFFLIVLWRRGAVEFLRPRKAMLYGFAGGAMSVIAYWLVIWAMTLAPLGPVAALRETSVVFAALISGLLLKEGLGWRAVAAALIVAAGVILLKV
ncbi:MAG: EamA family transporter [Alphaproteobacteria bacterium HGW-Alphaproteobacteria-12]|nr:MAG: EamA family transporter [Alphaproteobacteria bacterium HGW-Alphaproteobacteria-12]